MFNPSKASLLWGLFLWLPISASAFDIGPQPANTLWFSVSSDNYSESLGIWDLYQDDPEFAEPGEVLYSFSQWQYGYQLNELVALGFIRGLDLYVRHSSAAANIYYLSNTKNSSVADGNYSYIIKGDVQRTQGLFIALNTQFNNLSVYALLEGGQAFGLTSLDIDGNLDYQDEQLAGSFEIDYFYESDALYHRKLTSIPEGRYWSVSLKLDYVSPWGEHRLSVIDLFNETYWSNAPHTQAILNTDRIANIDEDGIITVRPLGSGRESFKNKTQIFPARVEFKNYFTVNKYSAVILGLKAIDGQIWPYMGSRIEHADIDVSYHFNEQSISLEQRINSNFRYQLAIDQIAIKHAQRIQFGLTISY